MPRSANEAQIKRAYRKVALKYHPDKVQGNEEEKKEAAAKFAEISHGACGEQQPARLARGWRLRPLARRCCARSPLLRH